jgi:hypothetical protein
VHLHNPGTPLGSPVGAVLLCDLEPSAALCTRFPLRGSLPPSAGPFSSCRSQGQFYNEESRLAFSYAFENGPANDVSLRDPRRRRGEGPTKWEANAGAARRCRSLRQNRPHRRAGRCAELCSTRSASEECGLVKRGASQEGQRGTETRSACSRHVIWRPLLRNFLKIFSNISLFRVLLKSSFNSILERCVDTSEVLIT